MNNDDITLCLTIGKRPKELRQTLQSLFQFEQFNHIIAINDFGDDETSQVFKELCPNGTLINLGHQVGHHNAVDAMYQKVKTPYIFHCEDDWEFTASLRLEEVKKLLESNSISIVCFRKIEDFPFVNEDIKKIRTINFNNIDYCCLDKLHRQWHRYTFNPHITKISLWQSSNCHFGQFKKERHISRWQAKNTKHVAFMKPGVCKHIGDGISVAHPHANRPPSPLKKMKRAIKMWMKSLFSSNN